MNGFAGVATYLGAITAVTLAGGTAPLMWSARRGRLPLLVAFGGGVLLGAAFLGMLPEVRGLGQWTGAPILAGFVLVFVLEKYVLAHPCGEVGCEMHPIGMAAFLGLSFHSLLDGLAVGSSFMVPHLAPAVFLAIAFHKLPAAFSLCSILLIAHYSRKRTLFHMLMFSLTTPLGALIAWAFLHGTSERAVAIAIGVSAGSFLAIATSDVLQQIHRTEVHRAGTLLSFLAGIALMAITGFLGGGGGGHAGH